MDWPRLIIGTFGATIGTIIFEWLNSLFMKRNPKRREFRDQVDLICENRAYSLTFFFSAMFVTMALPWTAITDVGIWRCGIYAIMIGLVFFSARWYYRQKAKKHPDTIPVTNGQ